MQLDIGRYFSSVPQSPREHVLVVDLHILLLVQSTLPHAQAAELATDPSEKLHGASLLHRFSDCQQNIPVESADWQSTLPHAQAAELAEDPSDAEQVGGREHMLLDNVQAWNCAQSALPHAQAAELAKDPSDTAQAGILRHWFLLK